VWVSLGAGLRQERAGYRISGRLLGIRVTKPSRTLHCSELLTLGARGVKGYITIRHECPFKSVRPRPLGLIPIAGVTTLAHACALLNYEFQSSPYFSLAGALQVIASGDGGPLPLRNPRR